ncbi:MAG: FtsQ-type POTRA domain-containing protein [Acidobacteriota bacterium]
MALSQSRTRAQVIAPRTTQKKSKPTAKGFQIDVDYLFDLIKTYAKPIAVIFAFILLFIAYKLFTASRLFEVKQIEVAEASPAVRSDIEIMVRRLIGKSRLMDVDLNTIRQKILTLQRVREAWVARVLPDKIQINVNERQPAVLARRDSGNLVWFDIEGLELGEFFDAKAAASTKEADIHKAPPTVIGLNEGGNLSPIALAENRERIAVYKEIEKALSAKNSLWELINEVDLQNPNYVKVNLVTSTILPASPVNFPVKVILGNDDFRNRFETALQILQAIKDQDTQVLSRSRVQDAERLIENADKISSIDASKPGRTVFSFSSPIIAKEKDAGTSKQVANVQDNPEPAVQKKAEAKTPKKPESAKPVKAQTAKASAKPLKTAVTAANRPTQATKQAPGKKK